MDPFEHYRAPVDECIVPGCHRPAERGENWRNSELTPIVGYKKGVELQLAVKDIAVTLTLCREHADELTDAGWRSIFDLLTSWNWSPLDDR